MKRLPGKRGEHHYDPQQVLYLIGNINYCYLYMVNGEVILSCRTLKWFADQWPCFLRVHKKALINQAYITFCKPAGNSTDTNYVIMADQTQFEIARRRVPAVLPVLSELRLVS
ncbi:hypothetical protein GCM10028808_45680 [Spirosoma migulaei]